MTERTIIGVDFSGAGADSKINTTWVTAARLQVETRLLTLGYCKPMSRDDLVILLESLPNETVAAMDFPFSVPWAFAQEIVPDTDRMPELWRAVTSGKYSNYDGFERLRDDFVKKHKERIRCGDAYFDVPLSPLHKSGPNMLPMTFAGMQMLHRLWESKKRSFRILPLPRDGRGGPRLLETMPRIALRTFDLPDENYKGYRSGMITLTKRRQILAGLPGVSKLHLTNLSDFREECIFSDDCVDSIVAAMVAALWVVDQYTGFRHPSPIRNVADIQAASNRKNRISPGIENMTEQEVARLEGWIYALKQ